MVCSTARFSTKNEVAGGIFALGLLRLIYMK